jgi:hypothetical protein
LPAAAVSTTTKIPPMRRAKKYILISAALPWEINYKKSEKDLKLRYSIFVIIFILGYNFLSYAQSKGGRWQFENNGFDKADWDMQIDNGQLNGPAYFSSKEPVPEGTGYLCLDSLEAFDFFKVEDSEDLDFDNENIGISLWMKPTVISNVHFIINKGVQDTNPKTTNYALRISNTSHMEFLIRDQNNQAQVAASDITISSGIWYFIAVYYNYTEKKVYFWDKLALQPADTVDFDQDYFSNNDPLAIGSFSKIDTLKPSIRDFEGYIDDVRISGRLEDILRGVSSIQSDNIHRINFDKESVSIYPNPISITSGNNHIKFQIESHTNNLLDYTIYNILGQQVFHGRSENLSGVRNIQWKLEDRFGHQILTGIYFVVFSGLQDRVVKKFLVVK